VLLNIAMSIFCRQLRQKTPLSMTVLVTKSPFL
jgi:hypothetical protein